MTEAPNTTQADLDANLDHLKSIGANHIQLTANMDWLCSTSTCDFSNLTPVIDGAKNRRMTVALQVHGTPSWVNSAGIWYGPSTDTEISQWTNLFHQLVAQYGTKVDYYEVWNEPDDSSFWQPSASPHDYTRLLHSVYLDAKTTDPNVQIVAGNFGRSALGYLNTMYDEMAAMYSDRSANNYFYDILGIHPYAGNSTSGFDPNTAPGSYDVTTSQGAAGWEFLDYRRMYDTINTREGKYKDLAFGEMGYTTTSNSWFYTPESTRATYLNSAYTLARNDGFIRYMSWYCHDGSEGFSIHGTSTETGLTNVATAP